MCVCVCVSERERERERRLSSPKLQKSVSPQNKTSKLDDVNFSLIRRICFIVVFVQIDERTMMKHFRFVCNIRLAYFKYTAVIARAFITTAWLIYAS